MHNTNTNINDSRDKGSGSGNDRKPTLSTVRKNEAVPTSGRERVENQPPVVAEESTAQIPDGAPPRPRLGI